MHMHIYVCTNVHMTYYCDQGRSVKECMITCGSVHHVWASTEGVD